MSVEGIENQQLKEATAILLENQEKERLEFGSGFDLMGSLNEGEAINTTSQITQLGADSAYKPLSMALVRRTFPSLFANQIVGVQPMSTPVGLAYALRFLYDDGINEAGWDVVPEHSGYTGSTSGTSGTADAGTGVSTSAAESWEVSPTGAYPQLKLKLEQTPVEAKTRKLAASFSLESIQDISTMQGINIEREIIEVLQYEVLAEMDREIIQRVKNAATSVALGGETATSLDLSSSAFDGRWSQEKLSQVVTSIVHKANVIGIKTRRGQGNYAIVSNNVATALQAVNTQFNGNDVSVNPSIGVPNIGSLNNGAIKIFRDTYATSDYALVGYKGSTISDCGVIFSPYITGVVNRAVAQEDFSPRIGVMSRYALTDSLLGAGRYYRQINYSNLNSVIAGASV
jgi:hypothetical protein